MKKRMKMIMDADCLIKLTKSGIKEEACQSFAVAVPLKVKHEVVDAGSGHPDADVVKRNIDAGLLSVEKGGKASHGEGEREVLALYETGGYDCVCSDDRKFLRTLRAMRTQS